MSAILVLTTVGDLSEAHRTAETLVERRLAACVQLSQISSVYRWKGEVVAEPEVRLFIKSTDARFEDLSAAIRELSSYEAPQIVKIAIDGGDAEYLEWVAAETA